jgi:hypothetical protein
MHRGGTHEGQLPVIVRRPQRADRSGAVSSGRICLVHWNVPGIQANAGRVRGLGYTLRLVKSPTAVVLRPLADRPPDVFVISLERSPSTGRDVALFLRSRKASRTVPIVFVASPESDLPVRLSELLPDCPVVGWNGIGNAIRGTMDKPPSSQPVRNVLAGYSGTPLPRKLGIRPGSRVGIHRPPTGFRGTLGPLPDGARLSARKTGPYDVVLLFVRSRTALAADFPDASRALAPGGKLWIAWPKKTSAHAGDIGEREVRAFGLAAGFVDYKVAAIDPTWAGLCFARRSGGGA